MIIVINLKKFLIFCLVFLIVAGWIFSGFPRIWQNPRIPPEIREVNATEALTNGGFTGGTTGWALSVATYDSTTYQAGPGSVTTVTAGRNKAATGTVTHNSVISTNAADTVTLSFYWKKNCVYETNPPVTNTISVQIQTSGGDWSTPTTLWTDTTLGVTDWTYVSQDVSGNFGTGNYDFRLYMNLKNGNDAIGQTFAWFDTVGLDVVAGAIVSVAVSDGTITYEIMGQNSTKSTCDLTDTQTLTNDGNVTEIFNIKAIADASTPDWTIGAAAGSDIYVHKYSSASCPVTWAPEDTLTTGYKQLASNIAGDSVGTVDLNLQINTPNPSSVYTQQSVDVTIQAVQQP